MDSIEKEVINTTKQIADLVDWLVTRHLPPVPYSPTMYIDLEGVNLCREGSLSIFTLLIDIGIPTRRVCLVDVHTLGAQAFNTTGVKGKTLKDILQDGATPKVFFDVRNDSDALFALFGVALQGVEDVQLMESATRETTAARKWLNGLAKCVEDKLRLPFRDDGLASWKQAKKRGEQLFKADHGGSYEVFNERPMMKDIMSYCVGDVQHLPELRRQFLQGQTDEWRDLVCEEAGKRVAASQRPDYQPHDPDKRLAPWSREQNTLLDRCSPKDPFVGSFDSYDDEYDDYNDMYDDGPTSCRDIISSWDLDYYYSD